MKKLIASFSVILLASCAVSSTQGTVAPEKRSGGIFGLVEKENIEVDNKEAFKGSKDVVIASFKVGFLDSKRMDNKASGGILGGGGFGGKSTGLVKLTNVSDKEKQAATNAAYADFTQKLKDAGYNIVDRSKLLSSEEFKGTKMYKMPYVNDTSSLLSSYGTTTIYSPTEFGAESPIFFGEVQDVTGGFGTDNAAYGAAMFADKHKIKVINVNYVVDFAAKGGHAGMFSSSLEVGQALAIDQGLIGLTGGQTGTFSNANGSVKLGQPIASGKTYGEVVSNTSDAEVGVETALNVATALLGGGTNQTREYEFKADAAKYQSISTELLLDANKALVGQMSALK